MKNDFVYVANILDAIDYIQEYTESIDAKIFLKNSMIQHAVIRNLEIIGEATKNLSNSFRDQHSEIPWKKMAGMRDKLIHNYMGVDLDTVWETVEQILPDLKPKLRNIVNNKSDG